MYCRSARRCFECASEHLEERALAGTIAPEDPDNFTTTYFKGHIGERGELTMPRLSRQKLDEHVFRMRVDAKRFGEIRGDNRGLHHSTSGSE